MNSAPWDDPRIARGMAIQLQRRRERLDAGEKAVGWKVAFGAAAAMERLRITAPLFGFLMQRGVLASGATVSVAGWANPVLEPEIAVHICKDVPAGADREVAAAAIGGVGPAVFIRAPQLTERGPAVEELARHGDQAVAVKQGNRLALAFHPELTPDRRWHQYFLSLDGEGR